MRQRKAEKVHSTISTPPGRTTPRTGDMRIRRKHLLRVSSPPPSPAGRHFFFSFPRKGDAAALNGGAIKSRPVDRARPVCLRPKSRRFAAVGLRHAPAGAVSFSSGKKNWGPRAACRVGRGGRNGAERSPRRQAGTEWAEFLPTTWGVHCTSHLHG